MWWEGCSDGGLPAANRLLIDVSLWVPVLAGAWSRPAGAGESRWFKAASGQNLSFAGSQLQTCQASRGGSTGSFPACLHDSLAHSYEHRPSDLILDSVLPVVALFILWSAWRLPVCDLCLFSLRPAGSSLAPGPGSYAPGRPARNWPDMIASERNTDMGKPMSVLAAIRLGAWLEGHLPQVRADN